jgi:hypothetical protein
MIAQTDPGLLNGKIQGRSSCLKYKTILVAFIVFGLQIAATSVFAAEFAGSESKLVVHGFLSQAYANSSGAQNIGIPDVGTSNYRNAALQFRYNYSSQDAFVLQFSHSALGESPLNATHDEVQLNWVFYQRRLLDTTSMKVGKFPVPVGIYNEVLHVGTVLPFYRPPFNFYGDGAFSSETINGIGFYNTFRLGNAWGLEVDLYAGEWIFLQQIEGSITPTRSRDILGAQIWLQTPIEGVRIGAAGNRSTDSNLPPPHAPTDQLTHQNGYLSFDANMEHFVVQAEYFKSVLTDQFFDCYYGLIGVKLFDNKLGINFMAEFAKLTIPNYVSDLDYSEDYAVGLKYAFEPNLVLKVEHHQHKTYGVDAPPLTLLAPEPADVKYYIVSLSASF